jgi:hypothetical protein
LCFDQFPNVNKRLIHTDKNAGYALGLHQSLSDLYDTLKEYDNVIHFHCDVFIIDENKLIDVMNSNQEYPFIFSKCNEPDPINCAISPDHRMISTDIFIIHPKVLKMNVFSNYIEYMNKKIWCEIFLQTELEKNKIPYAIVKRYDNESWFPRRPCMWGGWHEHDFSQIIQMI